VLEELVDRSSGTTGAGTEVLVSEEDLEVGGRSAKKGAAILSKTEL
jgi:hypothetical protein